MPGAGDAFRGVYNPRMSARPEVTVAAVVEREGSFLVVEERISGRRVFNQPAGHVEDRETLLQASVRETLEETAWDFLPDALLGIYLWRNARNGKSTLRFAFTGTVARHHAERSLDEGIIAAHWLTRADLEARSPRLRSPLVLRCIDDYERGQRLPLESVAYLDLNAALHVRAVDIA